MSWQFFLYNNLSKGLSYKLLELSHCVKDVIYSLLWHKSGKMGIKNCVVCKIDGRVEGGGMVDRFKGIISAFAFAKMRGLEFRIHYTYPFMLQDYLQPNKYDWVLKAGELTDSLFRRRVFYGIGEYSARRLLALNGSKQIHYYSNRDLLNNLGIKEGWGALFHELFCLSPVLERDLNLLLAKIGQPYIAVVFRFQALLGDFKEYNFPTLKTQKERNDLIDTCINSLLSLTKSYGSSIKVLVTSDSMTFLERISSISVFFTIPGRRVHIDNEKGQNFEVYEKSFLDFFMISHAIHVYSIGTEKMYPSQFPQYAALINNVPFTRIRI